MKVNSFVKYVFFLIKTCINRSDDLLISEKGPPVHPRIRGSRVRSFECCSGYGNGRRFSREWELIIRALSSSDYCCINGVRADVCKAARERMRVLMCSKSNVISELGKLNWMSIHTHAAFCRQLKTFLFTVPDLMLIITTDFSYFYVFLCLHPRGTKRWCCLTSVCLTSVAYIRSAGGVCGWLDGVYWLGRPGSRLPLRASVAGLGGGIRGGRLPTACLFLLFLCFFNFFYICVVRRSWSPIEDIIVSLDDDDDDDDDGCLKRNGRFSEMELREGVRVVKFISAQLYWVHHLCCCWPELEPDTAALWTSAEWFSVGSTCHICTPSFFSSGFFLQ